MNFEDFMKLSKENPEKLEEFAKKNFKDNKAEMQKIIDHIDDYDSFALITVRGGEARITKRGNPFELMAVGEAVKNDAEKMLNSLPNKAQDAAAMMAFMNMLKGAKDDE